MEKVRLRERVRLQEDLCEHVRHSLTCCLTPRSMTNYHDTTPTEAHMYHLANPET